MLPLSDREKRWGWTILLVFLLFIILPYAWAFAITPPGFTWGGLLFSTDDQNVHLTWARQAQDGAFFVRDLFTTEGLVDNTKPLFFNGLMLVIGWLSRLSGLEVVIWYQIVRVAGAAWALWQLHLLSWEVTGGAPERENARIGTLALAAFTSGAGFIASISPVLKDSMIWIDRADNPGWPMMPEAFFFLSALIYSLNIVSFGLLILVFSPRFERQTLDRVFGRAGAGQHPHLRRPAAHRDGRAVGGVAMEKRARHIAARPGCNCGRDDPDFISNRGFSRLRRVPRQGAHADQTAAYHRNFGSVSVFVIAGRRRISSFARPAPQARNLMALWAITTLAMVYAPVSFSRKMIEGLQIPLLVLAGIGLTTLKRPWIKIALVAAMADFADHHAELDFEQRRQQQ